MKTMFGRFPRPYGMVIVMVVVAALASFGLFGMLVQGEVFPAAASTPTSPSMQQAYPIASATPLPTTVLVATATSSGPPPPAGVAPGPLPTLDLSRVTVQPTWSAIPGAAPTATPTRIPFPTQPPWNVVTPSAAWTTYRDPNFGFSFQYPGNWHMDTHGPNAPVVPEGTYVAIRNFDLGMRKGPIPPDVLSIEVSLSAELTQYGTVNNWLARQKQNAAAYPEVRYSPEEYFTVAGVPAVRFTVTAPTVPQGNRLTVWGKGKWLYVLSAMPASSPYLSAVDGIVSSFQIP